MRFRTTPLSAVVLWASLVLSAAAHAQGEAEVQTTPVTLESLATAQYAGDDVWAAEQARILLNDTGLQTEFAAADYLALRLELADILADGGDLDGALSVYEAALTSLQDPASPLANDVPTKLDVLKRSAALHMRAGDPGAAFEKLKQAARLAKATFGEDHPSVAPILVSLLDVEAELSRIAAPLNGKDIAEEARTLRAPEVNVLEAEAEESLAQIRDRIEGGRRGPGLVMGGMDEGRSEDGAEFEIVKVFYGTNRAPEAPGWLNFSRSDVLDPESHYGGERGPLETGYVNVSMPKNKVFGAIPKPSILRGEFRPDPAKHVILEDMETFGDLSEFIDALRREIDRSQRQEAFIFIHGYNVKFAGAIERTAQIAFDLELDGAPILYSWPSQGRTLAYTADRNQIVKPIIEDLENFLHLVATEAGAETLHVVAHSMGNEFLLQALEELDERDLGGPLFNQVVFAAPDVDADHFAGVAKELTGLADTMTLYASSKDAALKASKMVGGGRYRRAGDSNPLLVVEGMSTVDTTLISDSSLGHADIFGPALPDFQAVIWHSLEPDSRCVLERRGVASGLAWAFGSSETVCGTAEFKAAMTMWRRIGFDRTLELLSNQIELSEGAGDAASLERWRDTLEIIEGLK